jgi:hypothetical protein
MVIGKVLKYLLYRDEMIWHNIKRVFMYPYYRFEHYRLE